MAIDFDLVVEPSAPQQYHADLRISLGTQDAPITPLATPIPISIDLARLRELASDPPAYGAALSGMLFASNELCSWLAQARAVAAQQTAPLRLRLTISLDAEALHALRWEMITDPHAPGHPLAASAQILLSRTLPNTDWQPPRARPQGVLRALAVVAAPADLSEYGLAPFDSAQELAPVRERLSGCALTVLDAQMRASLPRLLQHLHTGCDLLFVQAHGRLDESGQTWVYLEDDAGKTVPVPGRELVARIAALAEKPQLIILGCCESAGDGSSPTLAALGPQLVRAGVSAVLAMQGRITVETLGYFLPALLQALHLNGQIDRAIAVARDQVRDRPDWWVPALFMRPNDGRLWREPAAVIARPPQIVGGLSIRQRDDLLTRQAQRYHALITNALATQVRIQIGLHTCPEAVDPAWRRILLRSPAVAGEVPSGTSPLALFDGQQGQLLVLGAPGAGKTLLIIELAQALTARAKVDGQTRIPVVLNIATWRSGQTLRQWLVPALRDVLGASKRFAAQLASSNDILLLVDGLDEVAADQRAACVEAINAYLGEDDLSPPLVVGCRTREYAAIGAKLMIASAIELKALDLPALEQGLANVPAAQSILAALQTDAVLCKLVTTPLMVNVLLLAHAGQAMPLPADQTVDERRQTLWATYARRMLVQRPLEAPWQAAQALRHLRWLALTLRAQNQTNFLIDDLQPAVLPSASLRRWYRILAGPVLALLVGLSCAVLYTLGGYLAGGLGVGIEIVGAAGVGGGLIVALCGAIFSGKSIMRTEQMCWSWAHIRGARWHALGIGLLGVLGVGLIGVLSGKIGEGLVGGLGVGLIGALSIGWYTLDLTTRTHPMQGINASLRTGLMQILPAGLVGALSYGLPFGLKSGITNGLIFGSLFGIIVGLVPILQHYLLRLLLTRADLFPFWAITFLDEMTERLLLERDGAFYRFRHLLLRDYVAGLDDAEIEHLARS